GRCTQWFRPWCGAGANGLFSCVAAPAGGCGRGIRAHRTDLQEAGAGLRPAGTRPDHASCQRAPAGTHSGAGPGDRHYRHRHAVRGVQHEQYRVLGSEAVKKNNLSAQGASGLMQRWPRAVPFGLSLLLAACASTTPAPGATPPGNAAAPAPAPAQTAPAAQVQLPPAPDAESLGINREGRVIDLTRAGETPPAVTPPANDSVELNYEQEDLRV